MKFLYPWYKNHSVHGEPMWNTDGVNSKTCGWCIHQTRNRWYWAIQVGESVNFDYAEGYISGEEKAKARVEKEMLDRGYMIIDPKFVTFA